MTRLIYTNTKATATTVTGTAESTAVSLSVPNTVGQKFVIFWSGVVYGNGTTSDSILTVKRTSTVYLQTNLEMRDTNERVPVAGFFFYTGTGITWTFDLTIKGEAAGNTFSVINASLIALELTGNDVFGSADARTATTSTTPVSAGSISMDGYVGTYTLLACGLADGYNVNQPVYTQITDSTGGATALNCSAPADVSPDNLIPVLHVWGDRELTGDPISYDLKFRTSASGNSSGITGMRILALYNDDFANREYGEILTDQTTTSTSTSYVQTYAMSHDATTNPKLVIGSWWTTASNTAALPRSRIANGGTALVSGIRRSYSTNTAFTMANQFIGMVPATADTLTFGHYTNNSSYTARMKAGSSMVIFNMDNLGPDWIEPVTKVWDGASWAPRAVKVWDGSSWVSGTLRMKT